MADQWRDKLKLYRFPGMIKGADGDVRPIARATRADIEADIQRGSDRDKELRGLLEALGPDLTGAVMVGDLIAVEREEGQ